MCLGSRGKKIFEKKKERKLLAAMTTKNVVLCVIP
jgi:hypothetical protein